MVVDTDALLNNYRIDDSSIIVKKFDESIKEAIADHILKLK